MAVESFKLIETYQKFSHHCVFRWEINIVEVSGISCRSPKFSVSDCSDQWQLSVSALTEINDNHKRQIILERIGKGNCSVKFVKALLCLTIRNDANEVFCQNNFELPFSKSNSRLSTCFLSPAFYQLNRTTVYGHQVVFQDQMIIDGSLTVLSCCCKTEMESEVQNINVLELQKDFKALLSSHELADLTLKVEKDVLHAHKFVLCSRSPVFKKMLEHDMRESKQSNVEITDIKKSIMEMFLAYLYTGVIEDRKFDTVFALYSVADKYEVKTLHKTCSGILKSLLSVNTVTSILKLSDMHNDESLKAVSVDFVCKNFAKLDSTDEWWSFIDSNPSLASYTLKHVSSSILKVKQ